MDYITVNESFTAVIRLPDTTGVETVSYIVYTSAGASFATGSATYIAADLWKVTFTPTTADETYIVRLNDETNDTQKSNQYKAVTAQPVTTEDTSATDTQSLLDQVNAAIRDRLNGGGTQMYVIGGRTVQYISLSELTKWRDQLRAELSASRAPEDYQTHIKFMRPS